MADNHTEKQKVVSLLFEPSRTSREIQIYSHLALQYRCYRCGQLARSELTFGSRRDRGLKLFGAIVQMTGRSFHRINFG